MCANLQNYFIRLDGQLLVAKSYMVYNCLSSHGEFCWGLYLFVLFLVNILLGRIYHRYTLSVFMSTVIIGLSLWQPDWTQSKNYIMNNVFTWQFCFLHLNALKCIFRFINILHLQVLTSNLIVIVIFHQVFIFTCLGSLLFIVFFLWITKFSQLSNSVKHSKLKQHVFHVQNEIIE